MVKMKEFVIAIEGGIQAIWRSNRDPRERQLVLTLTLERNNHQCGSRAYGAVFRYEVAYVFFSSQEG